MTLAGGKKLLSIPGPTNVPDEVLQAMHRPAIDIYGGHNGGELYNITLTCLADLKKIFKTDGHTYIYISNGHGAWEAALSNTLSRGETVLALESGRFAIGWGEMGKKMGLNMEIVPGDWRKAVDANKLEATLRADTTGKIKAVLCVQGDTASGCVNDIAAIRAAINAAGHDALLMVDTIATLACTDYRMDEWGVDVSVGGSQKGLMTPPGLSFLALNDKALEAHKSADLVTAYWDVSTRDEEEHYRKYCGTPPVHLLFGLRRAMDMLLDEGLDNVFTRHRILCAGVHAAVDMWRQSGSFDFNVTSPSERLVSVTTLRMSEGINPEPIRTYCAENFGVTLGLGIGGLSGKAFRIGHMGHVNAPMVLGTLGSLEVTLQILGLIGDTGVGGVTAATQALMAELSEMGEIINVA